MTQWARNELFYTYSECTWVHESNASVFFAPNAKQSILSTSFLLSQQQHTTKAIDFIFLLFLLTQPLSHHILLFSHLEMHCNFIVDLFKLTYTWIFLPFLHFQSTKLGIEIWCRSLGVRSTIHKAKWNSKCKYSISLHRIP